METVKHFDRSNPMSSLPKSISKEDLEKTINNRTSEEQMRVKRRLKELGLTKK